MSTQYAYYEVREKVCDVQFRVFLQNTTNRFRTVAEANAYSQQFNPRRSVVTRTYVCTVSPATNYTYYEVIDNTCDVQFSTFLAAGQNRFGTVAEANAYSQQFNPPVTMETKIYTCTVAPNTPYRYYEPQQATGCDAEYAQILSDYNASNRRMRITRYLKQAFRTPAQATTYIDSLPPYTDVNRDFSFQQNRVFQPRQICEIVLAFADVPNCPTFEFYVSGERTDINEPPQIPFDP